MNKKFIARKLSKALKMQNPYKSVHRSVVEASCYLYCHYVQSPDNIISYIRCLNILSLCTELPYSLLYLYITTYYLNHYHRRVDHSNHFLNISYNSSCTAFSYMYINVHVTGLNMSSKQALTIYTCTHNNCCYQDTLPVIKIPYNHYTIDKENCYIMCVH